MPLILSSWRTIDGVPLTSQRNTHHKPIEFNVEEALHPTPSLRQFQTFLFKQLLEDSNSGKLQTFSLQLFSPMIYTLLKSQEENL